MQRFQPDWSGNFSDLIRLHQLCPKEICGIFWSRVLNIPLMLSDVIRCMGDYGTESKIRLQRSSIRFLFTLSLYLSLSIFLSLSLSLTPLSLSTPTYVHPVHNIFKSLALPTRTRITCLVLRLISGQGYHAGGGGGGIHRLKLINWLLSSQRKGRSVYGRRGAAASPLFTLCFFKDAGLHSVLYY